MGVGGVTWAASLLLISCARNCPRFALCRFGGSQIVGADMSLIIGGSIKSAFLTLWSMGSLFDIFYPSHPHPWFPVKLKKKLLFTKAQKNPMGPIWCGPHTKGLIKILPLLPIPAHLNPSQTKKKWRSEAEIRVQNPKIFIFSKESKVKERNPNLHSSNLSQINNDQKLWKKKRKISAGFTRSLLEDVCIRHCLPSVTLDRYRNYCSDPTGNW